MLQWHNSKASSDRESSSSSSSPRLPVRPEDLDPLLFEDELEVGRLDALEADGTAEPADPDSVLGRVRPVITRTFPLHRQDARSPSSSDEADEGGRDGWGQLDGGSRAERRGGRGAEARPFVAVGVSGDSAAATTTRTRMEADEEDEDRGRSCWQRCWARLWGLLVWVRP